MTVLLALILSFSVGFPSERRVTEGDPVLVATAQTAPAECVASFDSLNNTSDHDTDLLIISGGQTFVLADVETGAHVVRTVPVTLGETVEIWLRANSPNGRGKYVTSLGGKVTFECDEPTTTTTPDTTTTVPETTTTSTDTTSTTVPVSTSTTSVPSSTTIPSTSSTTSTTVQTSSSSTIQTTTTWDPPPISLTVPTTPPDTLPRTGADTTTAAYAGLLALLAGAGLVWTSREAKEN